MAETVNVPKQQLDDLLRQNEQMRADLKMIVSISGEIMEMVGSRSVNAVTILTLAPKIIGNIQKDPEKAKFLEPENIQRIKRMYER